VAVGPSNPVQQTLMQGGEANGRTCEAENRKETNPSPVISEFTTWHNTVS